ncbi:Asparagine synthase (Glutamine-hydrolyzing) [Tenacibaculum litopenaei]|uniref:asparagine synthase (glutamine-hydrolyzing) n=1 Tax=Tenacibaculum litopenaei TaxID=396016 RepID=UPI0038931242
MCGFSGIISKGDITTDTLRKMGELISHRGPDNQGVEVVSTAGATVGFVHRRLSILDLSPAGNQPMWNEDRTVCMVYNGEVYNFNELKKQVEKEEGITFKSDSDSEVILVLYSMYGKDFVNRLNGMFAIVLMDINAEKVFMFRDRVGVKPLYYGVNAGKFYFGSELKSFFGDSDFTPKVDNSAVQSFLQYGYVPNHKCIYQGIHKVVPGAFISYDLNSGEFEEEVYWELEKQIRKKKNSSLEEQKNEFKELFESSFNYRMVSDVPVGVFLSGGYDSTLLTGILSKTHKGLKTFTIGFEDKAIDESSHAKAIASHFGTEHHEFICSSKDALNFVGKIPFFYDEPFGDPSAIPTMMVSEKASKHVKVVLSADGGDEIFAGYDKHQWAIDIFNKRRMLNSLPFKVLFGLLSSKPIVALANSLKIRNFDTRLKKVRELAKKESLVDVMCGVSQYISDTEIGDWIKEVKKEDLSYFKNISPNSGNDIDDMLYVDIKTHLPDQIMTKVDKATMFSSIEGREPLLDYRIIEKSFSLSNDLKIVPNTHTKRLLKSVVWDFVPKEMIERPKQGFVIPLAEWLRGPLRDQLNQLISEDELDSSLFNIPFIVDYKNRFLRGENLSERKLWHVFMFQMWSKQWETYGRK